MKAIILISEASLPLAKTLQRELPDTLIYTKNECEGCISITSCHRFIEEHFNDFDSIIFIGAMGICVRSIAGCIKNKYKDPAVVCVDSTGLKAMTGICRPFSQAGKDKMTSLFFR